MSNYVQFQSIIEFIFDTCTEIQIRQNKPLTCIWRDIWRDISRHANMISKLGVLSGD